jgi:hypothetical protein
MPDQGKASRKFLLIVCSLLHIKQKVSPKSGFPRRLHTSTHASRQCQLMTRAFQYTTSKRTPHAGSYLAQVGLREQQRIVSLPATSLSLRGHAGQGQILHCRDDWTYSSCRFAQNPARGATPRVTTEQQAHMEADAGKRSINLWIVPRGMARTEDCQWRSNGNVG